MSGLRLTPPRSRSNGSKGSRDSSHDSGNDDSVDRDCARQARRLGGHRKTYRVTRSNSAGVVDAMHASGGNGNGNNGSKLRVPWRIFLICSALYSCYFCWIVETNIMESSANDLALLRNDGITRKLDPAGATSASSDRDDRRQLDVVVPLLGNEGRLRHLAQVLGRPALQFQDELRVRLLVTRYPREDTSETFRQSIVDDLGVALVGVLTCRRCGSRHRGWPTHHRRWSLTKKRVESGRKGR